jgi:CheY-like chemotaxis protein
MTSKRPRVLIVEDDVAVAETLGERLLGEFEVEATMTAEAALDRLRQARWDAAIVDVALPGIDGYGLVRRMWDDPELREIPVAIISGGDDVRLPGNALAFFRKPIDPLRLCDFLRRFTSPPVYGG